MATVAAERVTLWERVTGQMMIRRFTLAGTHVALDKSEPLIGIALLWWGLALLPGGIVVTPTAIGGLEHLVPLVVWSTIAIIAGGAQVAGAALAWLGIIRPQRHVRLAMLLTGIWWWTCLALALGLSGLQVSPVVYGVFAVMSALNFRKAYLNGHGW